jgi:heptosyltransferase-1
VEENFADIPRLHPGVSSVIPVAWRRWRRQLFSRQTWREIFTFKKRLAEHHYDLVLDTQGLLKSALIATSANGPRQGHGLGSARDPLATLFYRRCHKIAWGQNAVTRNRQLAALALGYGSPVTPPDYGIRPPSESPMLGLPQRYIVGLHATSRESKLWPVDYWIALGKRLSGQGLSLVLPWGNQVEHQRALKIAASVSGAVVLPRLVLAELASVLADAVACVGVDTGLVHLAVALDVSTVAIYTDTDPLLTGTFGAHPERSLNLGGIGQLPSCDNVLAALDRMIQA